jgi:hypothetical protein
MHGLSNWRLDMGVLAQLLTLDTDSFTLAKISLHGLAKGALNRLCLLHDSTINCYGKCPSDFHLPAAIR